MSEDDEGKLRAYLDGELAPDEEAALELELASSSGARHRLSEVTALDEELARLLAIDTSEIDAAAAWSRSVVPLELGSQRRHSMWWVLALAAAVVIAVGLGMWRARSQAPIADELVATQRETIAIGTRAKAVAEPGSALSWKVDERGDASVRQTAGAVFYRVDAGDTFVVDTPAGRVTVLGTCFTVELAPMSNKLGHIASGIGGAALASAVFLTVHEGKVALANDRGELEVVGGQSARIIAEGGAPEIVERDDTIGAAAPAHAGQSAYAGLVRENSEQRQRLRALEAELAARKAESSRDDDGTPVAATAAGVAAHAGAVACAATGSCDDRMWTDATPDDLRELARCGRLLYDMPAFMFRDEVSPGGSVIEAAGLSEEESARFAAVAKRFRDELRAKLVGLATELEVPAGMIERLSLPQLFAVVDAVIDEELRDATQRAVANERAGLATAPTEPSAGERALRLQFDLGADFERRLATEFGPEAAHEMRRADGGWSSKTILGPFDACAGD